MYIWSCEYRKLERRAGAVFLIIGCNDMLIQARVIARGLVGLF